VIKGDVSDIVDTEKAEGPLRKLYEKYLKRVN